MNSRERIQKLLNRQIPDRMGLFEHMWPETLPLWLKEQGYPKNEADDNPVSPNAFYNYDIWPCGPWMDTSPRRGFQEVVEESDDWKLVRNGSGALLRLWKNKSGTPEHVDFEITTRKKWDEVKAPLFEIDPGRLGFLEQCAKDMPRLYSEGRYTAMSIGFVFEQLRGTLGDFCMMQSFLEDPDWIHDFCRVYTDFFKNHIRCFIEKAGKPDVLWVYDDLGYTNGLWVSPSLMRDMVVPYHRELTDFAHEQGMQTILHTCGDIRKGMDLILDAGYDCLQPMEAKVGNNVVEYAEKYGDRIAFMGNIDVMVLETGDQSLIRKEIESKVKPLREMKVPYIFHSDHSIPPTVKMKDYQYALEVFREFSEY